MVAFPITKLIDEAIFPAAALIIGKTVGLVASALLFNLPFKIEAGGILNILPVIRFLDSQSYIIAESYSNLAMFIAAALGTSVILIRAHFFHQSHINPKLHAKLISLNIEWLIAPSYSLYHQALVWLTYLWLTVAFLVLYATLNITFPQIAIIAFIVAANLSWVFALDIQKEVDISRSI